MDMTVLIGDENDSMREKIAGILSRKDKICSVTQCSTFPKTLIFLEQCIPHAIVMELKMAKESASFVKGLRKQCPQTTFFVYSSCIRKSEIGAITKYVHSLGADFFGNEKEIVLAVMDKAELCHDQQYIKTGGGHNS